MYTSMHLPLISKNETSGLAKDCSVNSAVYFEVVSRKCMPFKVYHGKPCLRAFTRLHFIKDFAV